VLRNQLKIIGTLQNVVLLVLSILAIPLAIALVIFLIMVLVSGLDVLWEATASATPLLLSIAIGCFVLTHSVVRGDDEEASHSGILRLAGIVLALGILPLAIMAAISMGTRIDQHGLSPDRIWALVAIAVAVIYGVGFFGSALRGRGEGWRVQIRRSNMRLAVLTCIIGIILALPIFNFGAVSANNQLARLEAGAVNPEEFDYNALAFRFGDAGREALAELTESENSQIAGSASAAAARWSERQENERRWAGQSERLKNLRFAFDDEVLQDRTAAYVDANLGFCRAQCVALVVDELNDDRVRIALIERSDVILVELDRSGDAWKEAMKPSGEAVAPPELKRDSEVEIRQWQGRRVYVDGQPFGDPFE